MAVERLQMSGTRERSWVAFWGEEGESEGGVEEGDEEAVEGWEEEGGVEESEELSEWDCGKKGAKTDFAEVCVWSKMNNARL